MSEEILSQISIEDFAKVQLRVGQILEAEKIEGSRKLLKLKVDIGSEVRQLVAGIAEAYDPASLLNKKVVVVANLKPARLMGVESNGMIVAASVDGRPVLATFSEEVPNGALLK
jgi:methionyl-tRNA synthetase